MSLTKMQAPLFIVGSPRSGTSLLRLIMTSHSQVVIPPECGFIIWLHAKYENWCVSDNNKSVRLQAYVDDLFKCKKMDTWGLGKFEVKDQIFIHQPTNYAELCAAIYSTYAKSIEKKFVMWGDKNNFYLDHLDELHDLYKNSRFLHIVRDGRDVACSYREVMSIKTGSPYAPKLETNVGDIAIEWSSNVMKIDSFMSLLPSKSGMTIKYEDLVSYPSNIIMSLCEWLTIPFESDMNNFYKENRNKNLEPELTLDWKKRTLEPISNEGVGKYAKILSNSEQYEFQKLAGGTLERYSYAT